MLLCLLTEGHCPIQMWRRYRRTPIMNTAAFHWTLSLQRYTCPHFTSHPSRLPSTSVFRHDLGCWSAPSTDCQPRRWIRRALVPVLHGSRRGAAVPTETTASNKQEPQGQRRLSPTLLRHPIVQQRRGSSVHRRQHTRLPSRPVRPQLPQDTHRRTTATRSQSTRTSRAER